VGDTLATLSDFAAAFKTQGSMDAEQLAHTLKDINTEEIRVSPDVGTPLALMQTVPGGEQWAAVAFVTAAFIFYRQLVS